MLQATSRLQALLALSITLLAAAPSAQAAEQVDVVFEITPTVRDKVSTVATFAPTGSTPLSGDDAKPFLLHYSITTDALAAPALPGQYRVFQSDAKTPWTDTWLSKPKPPGFLDRDWHVGSGAASLSWTLAKGAGLQGSETLTLRAGDGYDTLGLGGYSPSWIFYERKLVLSAIATPPIMLDSYGTATIAGWLSAHQGEVFHNAFEEAGIYGGFSYRDSILGDVVIKSVTAVPEPGTGLLLALGVCGLLALKLKPAARACSRTARHTTPGTADSPSHQG